MNKQILNKAIGIDLGTTNSAVAIMTLTDTDVIIHRDARTRRETTPSCVWKDPRTQQVLVGSRAFQRIGTTPEPIRSIKRSMGKQTTVSLTDVQVTPEEVSASILREMKLQIEDDVAQFTNETCEWAVTRAIVTVPAYFDQPQIEATRKAAEMAGLQVLELLHEPTAAASYYCWQNRVQNGTFLVYDFGGGTFDVSILRSVEGSFEVLGISGNNRLGGDDLDVLLAEELRQRLVGEGYELELNLQKSADRRRFEQLKMLAEGVKKALSTEEEFVLRSQSYVQDQNGTPINIDMLFERTEVEALYRPTIERTLPYCYRALELAQQKANVTLEDIDAIILAGGTTHIPLVREIVRQTLCADSSAQEPRARCPEPIYKKVDTIVALGAAIRAAASGGLEITDPGQALKVFFRGVGSTAARQATIGGRAVAVAPDVDINHGYIRLKIEALGYEDEQEFKTNGVFGFTRVPLQPGTENVLTFEIFTSQDKQVATITHTILQSQEALRPTGGAGGTATLPKTLYLEVNRDGKPYRKELLQALTTLPASREDTFFHPGETRRLRLPLYQQKKVIKEIIIDDLPLLPKGTPVNFTLSVDELAGMTIKGKVGSQNFAAQIEPPRERQPPTEAELQALEQTFQQAVVELPDEKQRTIRAQYQKASESYKAAVQRSDTEQAVHDYEEMEEISASIEQRKVVMEPPLEKFQALVDECVQLNRYLESQSGLVGAKYNAVEVRQTIKTQQLLGEQAFLNKDRTGYANALASLQAISDHLGLLYYQMTKTLDTRSAQEKAEDLLQGVLAEAERVNILAIARGRTDLQNEIDLLKKQVQATATEAQTNPRLAEMRLRQVLSRLEQIKNMLQREENNAGDGRLVDDYGA